MYQSPKTPVPDVGFDVPLSHLLPSTPFVPFVPFIPFEPSAPLIVPLLVHVVAPVFSNIVQVVRLRYQSPITPKLFAGFDVPESNVLPSAPLVPFVPLVPGTPCTPWIP